MVVNLTYFYSHSQSIWRLINQKQNDRQKAEPLTDMIKYYILL